MEKEDRETIGHMSETLEKILAVLSKPPNKAARIFDIVATGVGILGILTVIDLLKKWFGG